MWVEVERRGGEPVGEIDADGAKPKSKRIETGDVDRHEADGQWWLYTGPVEVKGDPATKRRLRADQAKDDRATRDPAAAEGDPGGVAAVASGDGARPRRHHIGIAR
jgi:hypothetical protein